MNKRGAKHSAATKEHFQAMREHHKAIGEHLDALQAEPGDGDEDEDDKDAQKLAKAASDLQKITTERDELAKAFAEVSEMLKTTLGQPAPTKGVMRAVPVAKVDDTGADLNKVDQTPVLKADGTVDHAATALKLTKAAYQQPRAASF